jgi:hypothetical protein
VILNSIGPIPGPPAIGLLLSKQLPGEPGIDFEFPNRLFDRGVFVRRFNIANGHLKASITVGYAPFVVGRLEVHFEAPHMPNISSGPNVTEMAGHPPVQNSDRVIWFHAFPDRARCDRSTIDLANVRP